jgi:hypothetical protein
VWARGAPEQTDTVGNEAAAYNRPDRHRLEHRLTKPDGPSRTPGLSRTATLGICVSTLLFGACAGLESAGPPPRQGGAPPLPGGDGPSSITAPRSQTPAGAASGGATTRAGGSARQTDGQDTTAPAGRTDQTPSDGDRGATVTNRPNTKPDWVAVFESPREAAYNEQRVIYVDRSNLQTQKLDNLTYYLARTREVRRNDARPKIQELAVLCEGSKIAPATSLRGEGTEDGSGNYTVRQAPTPLTSIDQFATQKVRIDPGNPNTFVIRAICLMGTERRG